MNPRRPLHATLTLLLALAPWACTSQTNDNFQNPPQGPPVTCNPTSTVPGCVGGSQGYICSSDRPDDGDVSLVCDDGTPGAEGMTLYCCAPFGQYWNDCTVDTSVAGCVGDSFGFRCTGPETPDEADFSLSCSAGTPSGGDTLYCCNSEVLAPECVACQADGHGCALASDCCSGVCGGDDAATCQPASCGANGGTCSCLANGEPCSSASGCCSNACMGGTCAPAPDCAGASIEYTCSAGSTPVELDSSLACTAGPSAGTFCCGLTAQ